MNIFQYSCEVTMKNTNQTHVGTWELLVKTDPHTSPPTRKYSYDVIVVGKCNGRSFIFLPHTMAYYTFLLFTIHLNILNINKGKD